LKLGDTLKFSVSLFTSSNLMAPRRCLCICVMVSERRAGSRTFSVPPAQRVRPSGCICGSCAHSLPALRLSCISPPSCRYLVMTKFTRTSALPRAAANSRYRGSSPALSLSCISPCPTIFLVMTKWDGSAGFAFKIWS
jgi:hypothetical protein